MSGICGYFRQDGRHIEEQVFADMLFLLERQGPDDQAYWQNGSVALGHTLLKTTRESEHEAQPSTLDGKTWLTADARIDGRVELIAKLHSKDVTVSQSVTDDHLILHAYAVWGADCLEHLIGDFAFILWDEKQKQLFCATDHMGVSPLYSAQVRGGFLVSNNLTAIRAHPQISNVLNEQAIGDYLMFRLNFTPDSTSFRDIKKLPAGHSIIVNQDTMRMQQYWSVPKPDYKRRTQAQYLEEFGSLFKQSVADRMRTDSIGTHLSGGMDSTSITAMLAELRNEGGANDVNAYTHAPPIGRPNLEQPYAEAIAQKLNIPLRVFNGKDRVLANDIDGIADLPPEPSFAQRESPRFKIFADSASKSSSFFAGYGGDPLLSPMVGYWSDLRKSGQFGAHITDAVLHMKVHGRPPSQMLPAWMRPSKKKRGGMQSLPLPGWLNDEFAARNGLADQYRKYGGSADLNRDARIEMGTHPLWRRIFEWHSPSFSSLPVKVRFPFFDKRMVEWFQTVPPYPWLCRKYLLRAIMEGRLPKDVLERPKTGLPSNPLSAKVEQGGAPDWAKLIPSEGAINEFVDIKPFLDGIDGPKRLTDGDTSSIVRVSTLNHWLTRFDSLQEYLKGSEARLQNYKLRK